MLLPEPIKRCAGTLRGATQGEDGFTIIEVLASAVLVALAVIGVFAALDSASATSGRDKAKNVAAQLAESDQERLRSLKVSAINDLRETRTETVDGDTYTIASRADWVNDASGTASCTGSNTTFDYLKIKSTVTWAGMGSAKPVASDSLRAVPNGSFSSDQGSLAIQISDRNGTGVPGVSVSITGAKSFTETTNANGCIFIGFVPAGTYTVSFSQAGYVESKLPNRTSVTGSVVVAGEQTTTQQYLYDRAGTASVKFQTTTDVNGPVVNVSDSNLHSFTVSHTGLGVPYIKSFTGTSANTATGGGLFPFTSAYAVWAGSCSQGDPTLYGQPSNPLTVPAGGTSAQVNVRMPIVRVNLTNAGTTSKVVIKPAVAGCTAQASYTITTSGGTNPLPVFLPLPYGNYRICAQVTNTSPNLYEYSSPNPATNTNPNGSAYAINLGSGTTSGTCP